MPQRRSARNPRLRRSNRKGDGQDLEMKTIPNPTRRRGPTAMQDLVRQLPVFASSTRRSLRYHEYGINVSSTTGVPNGYVFSANGLYDPNITGAGHQPMGFDQLMLFFEHYTVLQAKITATIFNSQSGGVMARGAVYLSPGTTILTNPQQIMENGQLVSAFLYGLNTQGSIHEFSLDVDIANQFGRVGRKRELIEDATLSGSSAANPSEQSYFIISVWDPFGANTIGWFADVVLEYDAVFWEPKKITVS
jgi:hypothetical protein